MLKSIYKITNKINGKCYIGQTNNIQRRFQEHRRGTAGDDNSTKLLYQAFAKYGLDNFTFEVIEENIENYDEREQYWINYYNAQKEGYNLTPGGNAPPILTDEKNPNTTHSIDQVNKVYELLATTNLSTKEIGQITGYSDSAVQRINLGLIRRNADIQYPIRKENCKTFLDDRALNIISDLLNTKMTQKEIAQKYGVGRSTVTAINNGQNHRQPDLNYPLRDKKNDCHSKTVVMCDKNTQIPIKEFVNAEAAAAEMGCSKSAIQLCCTGSTFSAAGYFWKYKDK